MDSVSRRGCGIDAFPIQTAQSVIHSPVLEVCSVCPQITAAHDISLCHFRLIVHPLKHGRADGIVTVHEYPMYSPCASASPSFLAAAAPLIFCRFYY